MINGAKFMKLRYHLKILKLHWETSQQIKASLHSDISLCLQDITSRFRTTCDHWALRCCVSLPFFTGPRLWQNVLSINPGGMDCRCGLFRSTENHRHQLPKKIDPTHPGLPRHGLVLTLLKIYDATVKLGGKLPPSFKGGKILKIFELPQPIVDRCHPKKKSFALIQKSLKTTKFPRINTMETRNNLSRAICQETPATHGLCFACSVLMLEVRSFRSCRVKLGHDGPGDLALDGWVDPWKWSVHDR